MKDNICTYLCMEWTLIISISTAKLHNTFMKSQCINFINTYAYHLNLSNPCSTRTGSKVLQDDAPKREATTPSPDHAGP